jgi:D-alanyl-D-alanine carboxypeptidase/D-alanyl-D-alanine-endopeptidase (penicillin-binding protein 4)
MSGHDDNDRPRHMAPKASKASKGARPRRDDRPDRADPHDDTDRPDRGRHRAGATRPPEREPASSGGGGGGGGDRPGRPGPERGHRDGGSAQLPDLRRWLLPVGLLVVGLVSGGSAIALNADTASSAVGDRGAVTTPVLSARRAPEVVAEPVARRRLTAELDAWLGQSPADTCLVVDDHGDTVYAHNGTRPLTGASTQKLLTSTALLLALGADARLETRAVAAQEPRGGVVAGDLFLVGGGDALLSTTAWRDHFARQPRTIDDIDQLARAIADAGVRRIEGSVVGDDTRYDDETYHPAWPRRFYDDREVGPIDGLMVNDGFESFPSAATPGAPTQPAADPGADAAKVLTLLLRAHGVEVVGASRSGEAPADAAEVASLPSIPVREVVAEMLRDSDNETAEAAIKEVGHAEAGEGSWSAGARSATDLLREAGVSLDGVSIVDGSGLSIENRLTCATLVDVLTRPETGPVVREGLAVAGETGTLAEAWDGTAADGRMRAKTGTLRNVTALAGDIEVRDGDRVTFAYVANVPDPNEVTSQQVGLTGLADVLMAYPRGVDVAQLEPAAPTPAAGG